MKWEGHTDQERLDGRGKFEEDGPWIHFDCFSDYFYLQHLFDLRKDRYQLQGKNEVLDAVKNYVEGFK